MFKKKDKIKNRKNIVKDYIEAILFAFVVAMIIRNYTFQNFKIPSSSMESTLLIGDYLVANKTAYFFSNPKRGDIVTFRYPADPTEPQPRERFAKLAGPIYWNKSSFFFHYHARKNVVKRVIGVPGDSLQIINDIVYINGSPYTGGFEQFVDKQNLTGKNEIHWDSQSEEYFPTNVNYGALNNNGKMLYDGKNMGTRANFGPVIVPPNAYFVLGDNRDMSKDSRWWGFLEKHDITGTPFIIFWSTGEPPIKDIRYFILQSQGKYHPRTRTRWERFFRLVK
ncbi:MAG: signal peptidase I [Candidatus Cloacimonetes bacterium]|nr:signal peptidase I [Candidatus Cloacimonadota bacterium]